MEFFLNDSQAERLPPGDTRLTGLTADPDPDGRRLRVHLEMTPFATRPAIELELTAADGQPAASASVIEPMAWKLELTLHIRRPAAGGRYILTARLNYPELGEVDRRAVQLTVPA